MPEDLSQLIQKLSDQKIQAAEEAAFRQWYAGNVKRLLDEGIRLDPNPDDPNHFYDYRAAYQYERNTGEDMGPNLSPEAKGTEDWAHWSSKFKGDAHPNRFINGKDTRLPWGKEN